MAIYCNGNNDQGSGNHRCDRCIGCNSNDSCDRCVPACPQGAISLELDPEVDLVGSFLERVAARTRIY